MLRIGARLREERTRLRFSQSKLGAIGGVETNAQGNYESGTRSPKASYLAMIAAVGIDISYVVTGNRARSASFHQAGVGREDPDATPATLDSLVIEQLTRVTHQLHRNLHGIIEALYQMTLLVDTKSDPENSDDIRSALDAIKSQAESLAAATVHLVLVTTKTR